MYLFRSPDGGKTIERSAPLATPSTIEGQTVVLSDGTVVHAFFGVEGDLADKVCVTTSRDGGRTLSPVQIVGGSGKSHDAGSSHPLPYSHPFPMLAVDRSAGPFRDRVYVVWTESSSGRFQKWLTYSTDAHATQWVRAHVVDDAAAFDAEQPWNGPNDANPAVAVNGAGVVGVFWADRRHTRGKGYWPRFMASLDGGVTWTKSVPVGDHADSLVVTQPIYPDVIDDNFVVPVRERPLLLHITPQPVLFDEPGDHWGLAADAQGVFHTVWTDDRTGVPQVRTAPITVTGKIRQLRNVTDDVRVALVGRGYDPTNQRAYVDVQVTNTSDHPMAGTLVLKSLDPGEFVSVNKPPRDGDLIVANADNGWPGPGAYWELHAAGSGAALRPGASTVVRRLEFHSRTREVRRGDDLGLGVYAIVDGS